MPAEEIRQDFCFSLEKENNKSNTEGGSAQTHSIRPELVDETELSPNGNRLRGMEKQNETIKY